MKIGIREIETTELEVCAPMVRTSAATTMVALDAHVAGAGDVHRCLEV
jgi:hypothetical protein